MCQAWHTVVNIFLWAGFRAFTGLFSFGRFVNDAFKAEAQRSHCRGCPGKCKDDFNGLRWTTKLSSFLFFSFFLYNAKVS